MQPNIDLNFIVGDKKFFEQIESQAALKIFDDNVCEFLNSLSRRLLKNLSAKNYPDVVTFAFWCRKASIAQMAAKYHAKKFRIGRGIIFHIAPSNVPVNFAYSCVTGLLSGNVNVVRLPSKMFPQVDIICAAINETLKDFPKIAPYIYMIRYGHEKEINDLFSSLCNVRVIWGGDNTIDEIRNSKLKARATEITFADRYSAVVINADEYLKSDNKERTARDFYNDTYLNDQNACTSPRIVIWYGNNYETARKTFWRSLKKVVDDEYNLQPVQAVDKLVKSFMLAIDRDTKIFKYDNSIVAAEVSHIDEELMNFAGNSGFFIEYRAKDFSEILPICDERCQTLSYFGFGYEEIAKFVADNRPRGIDRIVPIGRTLDFSLTWDGYDLIYSMSRIIERI